MQAGKNPLSVEEIIRLHGILIEDNRFVQGGLRTVGVFLGELNPDGEPLPEFIGANPEDVAEDAATAKAEFNRQQGAVLV
jgi:hypothetical protein